MRNFIFTLLACGSILGVSAQDSKNITLNAPSKQRGTDIMETFAKRQSYRSYSTKELSLQDLSDVLWAANGINRPAKGMRTAASAMNFQDIDIYVCTKDGAYFYDPKGNKLNLIIAEDLRKVVAGGQDYVLDAPVSLVLVSDFSKMNNGNSEQCHLFGALDAGIVSQNISIICAGLGLATIPRASMDKVTLSKKLKLKTNQVLYLNHPIGFTK